MSEAKGAFSLVLHGHLPWVLHHGRWPHGEDWLYEAVVETWLRLLDVLDRCEAGGLRPAWSVGVMPILLEQLAHPRMRSGLDDYLREMGQRAERDAAEFDGQDGHLAWLARCHGERVVAQRAQLDRIGWSVPEALAAHAAAGRIELLSSNATHGYMPLLLHDRCSRAQVRAGVATSTRHFGFQPRGAWLPECAYRGVVDDWVPPAVHGDARQRGGVAGLFAAEGVDHFFVDEPVLREGRSVWARDGSWRRVTWDQGEWDDQRSWRNPLEPHEIVEGGERTGVVALARAPGIAQQVWSADTGYPGDGRYLEFHKKHGMRGLRYWKVTGRDVDLGDKHRYYPDEALAAAREHAEHYANSISDAVHRHHESTGRFALVTAPFDAELFGHWWAEGPEFLWHLAQQLSRHPGVAAMSTSEAIERSGVDKGVELAEGSWGAGGDHRVWLHDGMRFYWELVYRSEDRFLGLVDHAGWQDRAEVREILEEAGRQLLLLQASDWAFVITTGGAVDYGLRRITAHAAALDDLCNGVDDLVAGRPVDPVVRSTLARCRLVDDVFPDLDLRWWQ